MSSRPTLEQLRSVHELAYKEFVEQNIHRYEQADFDGKQVLDIGGHVGFVTLLALYYGASRVITVEANPVNFATMAKNLASYPQVTPLLCAAYDGFVRKVGIVDGDSSGGGISKISLAGGVVDARSLEELMEFLYPGDNDMTLKIDTEGAEYDVILCASGESLRRFSTVLFEVHQVPPHMNQHPIRRCLAARTYMEFLGYELKNEEPVCWWEQDDKGNYTGRVEELDDMRAMRFKRVR